MTNVLSEVVNTRRIADACILKAAMEATAEQGLRANIPILRRIAAFDPSMATGPKRLILEDAIADALVSLGLMGDPGVVVLAREHLSSPASIAGSAVMTLQAMEDWASTEPVVNRLLSERDLQQNYALVEIALRFVSASPVRASHNCEALQRLSEFDDLPARQLLSPTVQSILEQKRALLTKFACN